MFYQDIRELNPMIGTFSNRLGNLIKATFQAHANDWNEVEPQHVTAVMTTIHNEYRFVYEDPATGEKVPADCIRNEIESTIIREMKRLRRNQKLKLSSRFFNKFCGKIELAREETPKGYTHEAWLKAIEVFNTPEHKVWVEHDFFFSSNRIKWIYVSHAKADRNRQNAKKKQTKARQGSIPFFAHRQKSVSCLIFINIRHISLILMIKTCRGRRMGHCPPH